MKQRTLLEDDRPVDTLPRLLANTLERAPSAQIVLDGGRSYDSAAFAASVEQIAAGLSRSGVERGHRVALWMTNGAPYLSAIFALARLGAVAVHVNTRFSAREIIDLLIRTDARLLIKDIRELSSNGEAKLQELLGTPALASLRVLDAADIPRADMPLEADAQITADDDCLVYTTGGTTSKPKLVVHRHKSILVAARQIAASIGLDKPGSSLLAAVPFCGTFGNNLAMAAVAAGATIVTMTTFDPDRAAALIRDHGITHAIGDDKMIARLADATGGEPFTSLRFFGAAAFGADSRTAFHSGLGAGIPIRGIYGSSEAQSFFGLDEAGSGDFDRVFPIYPEASFRIVDGKLQIRSPSLFDRYLDDPERTSQAFTDGWFRTGDRARRDGAGFIYEGREGDILRLGGFLVAPQEIEAFLTGLDGITEAVVVGAETERGTTPVAFVKAQHVFDESSVLAAARKGLARYKVPARVLRIDAFPVVEGPNGPKIARNKLRDQAAEFLQQD